MRKRIRLEDIAKVVGTSKMAVSLALRGDRSISAETRDKVVAVANEMGYVPNRMAQNLANGKSNTIALLISAPLHDDYQNQIIRGAIPYAMDRGYTIFVGPVTWPGQVGSYIDKYKNMMVDGFLAFPPPSDSSNYAKLKDEGIPFVLYTKYFHDLPSDYVVCNDFKGGYMMTRHLLDLGHRRFGFVVDYKLKNSSEVLERIRGFRKALEEEGIAFGDDTLIPYQLHYHMSNMSYEHILSDNEEFAERMKSDNRPTALFACNDITASSVYIALKKIGLRIPHDVSVGGYEGVYLGSIVDPPLTTIATSIQELGEKACQVLIDKIEGIIPKSEMVQLKIDPQLLIRNSTDRPG
jgi:LacI family transcriptional regulator